MQTLFLGIYFAEKTRSIIVSLEFVCAMSQVICKLSTLFPNSLEVGNRFKNIISKYMIVFSFQIVFPKNSSKCGLGLTLLEYGYVFFFSVITA